MSKIGKKPVVIPAWVEVQLSGSHIQVKGSKWTLERDIPAGVTAKVEWTEIQFTIDSEEHKNLWGLSRTLVNNMCVGVSQWYEKKLLIIGVWYGAQVSWQKVIFSLGYAHKVEFPIPAWIEVKAEQDPKWNTILTISWFNKELVGEIAAEMRALKKPEPYKGKWIRYIDEVVKLKAGKSAKK